MGKISCLGQFESEGYLGLETRNQKEHKEQRCVLGMFVRDSSPEKDILLEGCGDSECRGFQRARHREGPGQVAGARRTINSGRNSPGPMQSPGG